MKYTAADVREKRISFKGLTQEQFLTLQAHFHKLYPEDGYMEYIGSRGDKYHRFYAATDNEKDCCAGMMSQSYTTISTAAIKSTLEITFEEFDFGATDWIPWAGGDCPVPEGTLVDVRYRNGEENLKIKALGWGAMDWKIDLVEKDIVAYRVCKAGDNFNFAKEAKLHNEKLSSEEDAQFIAEVDKAVLEKMCSKSILLEAEELINGERAKDYGKVSDNFNNIAIGWNVIIDGKPVTARKVGLMMTWLKICRDVQNPKQDNLVDGAGYFGCIDKMSREQ